MSSAVLWDLLVVGRWQNKFRNEEWTFGNFSDSLRFLHFVSSISWWFIFSIFNKMPTWHDWKTLKEQNWSFMPDNLRSSHWGQCTTVWTFYLGKVSVVCFMKDQRIIGDTELAPALSLLWLVLIRSGYWGVQPTSGVCNPVWKQKASGEIPGVHDRGKNTTELVREQKTACREYQFYLSPSKNVL